MTLVKNTSSKNPIIAELASDNVGCHTKHCVIRSGGKIGEFISMGWSVKQIQEHYLSCDDEKKRAAEFGIILTAMGGSTNCTPVSVNDNRSTYDVTLSWRAKLNRVWDPRAQLALRMVNEAHLTPPIARDNLNEAKHILDMHQRTPGATVVREVDHPDGTPGKKLRLLLANDTSIAREAKQKLVPDPYLYINTTARKRSGSKHKGERRSGRTYGARRCFLQVSTGCQLRRAPALKSETWSDGRPRFRMAFTKMIDAAIYVALISEGAQAKPVDLSAAEAFLNTLTPIPVRGVRGRAVWGCPLEYLDGKGEFDQRLGKWVPIDSDRDGVESDGDEQSDSDWDDDDDDNDDSDGP